MEAIIYLKGNNPLKKIICKRENGKYIIENIKIEDSSYSYKNVPLFEEYSEKSFKDAFIKAEDTLEYIKQTVNKNTIEMNNLEALKVNGSGDFEKLLLTKISQIDKDIEKNKKTIQDLETLKGFLDKEDEKYIENLKKNIVQLEKAKKRIGSKIKRNNINLIQDIDSQIFKFVTENKSYEMQVKIIEKLRKKEPENVFFN